MWPCLSYLVIIAIILFSPTLAQQSKMIELRSADRLEGKTIRGEDVRELTGSVHFVQIAAEGGLVRV